MSNLFHSSVTQYFSTVFHMQRLLNWPLFQYSLAACNCNFGGTERPACNKTTGVCNCREGVSGQHCNKCAWGHCKEFPKCTECHPCFKLLDEEICALIPAMERLSNKTSTVSGKLGPLYDEQFKELEKKITEIAKILNGSVASPEAFQETKNYFDKIR